MLSALRDSLFLYIWRYQVLFGRTFFSYPTFGKTVLSKTGGDICFRIYCFAPSKTAVGCAISTSLVTPSTTNINNGTCQRYGVTNGVAAESIFLFISVETKKWKWNVKRKETSYRHWQNALVKKQASIADNFKGGWKGKEMGRATTLVPTIFDRYFWEGWCQIKRKREDKERKTKDP